MASPRPSSCLDKLPDEILLHILSYLEPYHISRLQLISRRLQRFCLDDELWKRFCFEDSPWYKALNTRRTLFPTLKPSRHRSTDPSVPPRPEDQGPPSASPAGQPPTLRRRGFFQDMANWDPVFPAERISWYDEYIQRHGPASVSWLQTPRLYDGGLEAMVEVRGMALYNPYNGSDGLGTMLAVSPLDDGSVCLWDVKGSRARCGAIVARSKPGILFVDGPGTQSTRRSKKIDTGVTECVSVNHSSHKAFFAVQSHLIEVDLNQLRAVSRESFEWSITTLSSVDQGLPLTVGTSQGIHLHDFRSRARVPPEVVDRLDGPGPAESDLLKAIFDPKPLPPYAPLSQPTPISILHPPRLASTHSRSDDIYVSGRFSNILHYDRRKFPSIMDSIYSGALIKSLACLPFPFSSLSTEVRRRGELTAEQAAQVKTAGQGLTLVAAGGYKTKGSLEMYGIDTAAPHAGASALLQNSVLKNRQTAASATILSVVNHGTKILFSDGTGFLKWFERDGMTECRRVKIGHSDGENPYSLFASMPASDDLARKILSTQSQDGSADRPNNDNVLFWTGEKLGMVTFTTTPLCRPKDFEELPDPRLAADNRRRQLYADRMRRVLERQADEVKSLGGLGLRTAAG